MVSDGVTNHHLHKQESITKPIFYDLSRKRRRKVVSVLSLLILVLAAGVVLALHRLSQPVQFTGITLAGSLSQLGMADIDQRQVSIPASTISSLPLTMTQTDAAPQKILAFLPQWPDRSLGQVVENIDLIDAVLPYWYNMLADGSIVVSDSAWQARSARAVKGASSNLDIIPVVQVHARSDPGGSMFPSGNRTQFAVNDLVRLAKSYNFKGFCFEYLTQGSTVQSDTLAFLRVVQTAFSANALKSCIVHPLGSVSKWQVEAGKLVDWTIVVAVNVDATGEKSMPLAAQPWFSQSLAKLDLQLDTSKVIIALGSHGSDWVDGNDTPTTISYAEATRLSRQYNVDVLFDADSLNSRMNYTDARGRHHQVWLLDAASAYNQMVETKRAGIRRTALHSPGEADPGLWKLIREGSVERFDPSPAEEISLGNYVGVEGDGELFRVTGLPQNGLRKFTQDPTNDLIIEQFYSVKPASYILTRWGGDQPSELSLTFDDGPDAEISTKILDILKEYGVPATFFVVGENVMQESDLLQRMIMEGHEVGNHFYSHANMADIGSNRLALEVNATQRLLASVTGRQTTLLRPPYGTTEPGEMEASGVIASLAKLSGEGYVLAGNDIDPQDWRGGDAKSIAHSVIQSAVSGEGNVILLHDAGGNRLPTVEALPHIIKDLRAKGFSFVPLAKLLNKTRADVMPLVNKGDERSDGLIFSLLRVTDILVMGVFSSVILLTIVRALLICTGALLRRRHAVHGDGTIPSVTVVIAAYNEEKVILKTIASILQANYPRLKIIVIDDGSTDGTYDCVRRAYGHKRNVKISHQANAGKAAALNYGFALAKSEIVVSIDADTVLLPDAIGLLAGHFHDPRVAAVAGNAKVGNRVNLLTRIQAFEYIVAQNLDRRAFELLNCITVVPGAIGAWRRSSVLEAGGYPRQTLAEDADLTISLLRKGHRVVYEERAIALTEAPQSVGEFIKQRFRWSFGMLQVAWRHRGAITARRPVGLLAIPNIMLFQIIVQLLAPIVDVVFIYTFAQIIFHFVDSGFWGIPADLQWYAGLYAAFLAVDVILAVVAFRGEPDENKWLIRYALVQRFFYHQIIYFIAIRAVWAALGGNLVAWGKLKRLSTVKTPIRIRSIPANLAMQRARRRPTYDPLPELVRIAARRNSLPAKDKFLQEIVTRH